MPGFVDVHAQSSLPATMAPIDRRASTLCRLAYEAGTEILFATPHAHAPWDHYPRTEDAMASSRVARADASGGRGLGPRPAAGLGGVPERDRCERSRRARARRDPRCPDRVPGLWLDLEDPMAVVEAAELARRRGSCRCSPTPSVAAPSRPIRRASARSPSEAGSCVSMPRRSSAVTARRPSARHGRC